MKLSVIFPFALLMITLHSCTQNGAANLPNYKDSTFTAVCYIAPDGRDTAFLTLKKYNSKTEGDLFIKYAKKDRNQGVLRGNFNGDSLFVDYIFRIGDKGYWYKNPLALLKKDGKLFLGVGKMETRMGKTYFRKDIPIDFSRGRFVFEPVTCKNSDDKNHNDKK